MSSNINNNDSEWNEFLRGAENYVKKFTEKNMTPEEEQVFESGNEESVINYFKILQSSGEVPHDWPEPKLDTNSQGDIMGVDMPSIIFMLCLGYSDPKPNGTGFAMMPNSIDEIRDWIWTPASDMAFVYDPMTKRLRACSGDELMVVQTLGSALKNVSLGPLRNMYELPTEVNLADHIVSEARAAHEQLDQDTCYSLAARARDLMGISAAKAADQSFAMRKTAWGYLLSLSPRFDVVRTVVKYSQPNEPGDISFNKFLLSWEEAHQEDFVRQLALKASKDQINEPGTAVVVTIEGDPAFEFYKNHDVWDQMEYKGVSLSPDAYYRISQWEEQVMSTFKSPPLNDGEP